MRLTYTADGSCTLYSEAYRQTFHSDKGALSEARHVFVQGAAVDERLRRGAVSLLEVGFGTGLNFFVTADVALSCGGNLRYTALEQALLPVATLTSLGYPAHLKHPELAYRYFEFRETLPHTPAPGRYQAVLGDGITLALIIGDAAEQRLDPASFDAIYQDAFSPDANPELWSEAFLAKLACALKPGGVLTSYSVKGEVRRRLARLGLSVSKRSGPPGGKREMLHAQKPTCAPEGGDWPTIRLATVHDAKPLAQLAERTFRDTFGAVNTAEDMALYCAASYGDAIQAAELVDPTITTLLCEDAGQLIGFAQLRFGGAPACVAASEPGEIWRFYIAAAWHGQGVAQVLMRACLQHLKRRGCDAAWLGVWEDNPRALAFYRKFGFVAVGEQVFVLGRDPQRDILMVRTLA